MNVLPPALIALLEQVPASCEQQVLDTVQRTHDDVLRAVAECCRLSLDGFAPVKVVPGAPGVLRWLALPGVNWPPLLQFEAEDGPPQVENAGIEDLLGRYLLTRDDAQTDERAANPAGIELYWRNIGLVATTLKVTVWDLTIVVLAHEVAHEYTHLGADLDGQRWLTRRFSRASSTATEALAQYLCEQALQAMTRDHPMALDAFRRLLTIQSPIYTSYMKWPAMREGTESVRRALLLMRQIEPDTPGAFFEVLTGLRLPSRV